MSQPLYIGWDLSTQQLKGIAVTPDLKKEYEAKADFDADFGKKYGIKKGVLQNPSEGEIYAPTAMWLEAIDLVLHRLKDDGLDFSRVKGISGAGMQHGTVFWGLDAEKMLAELQGDRPLIEQLGDGAGGKDHGAFSHPHSPNWQDASTQEQCEQFDKALGSPEALADAVGSSAHHRFSGPQIMRFRAKYPDHYKNTSRISLVSSFLASVFLGKIAHIDISDVGGMDLWDIKKGQWRQELLELAAGKDGVKDLRTKLGLVPEDGGGSMGKVSSYFVERYGFNPECQIAPHTGDNPSTILALPLQASDAIVSLGTSTTFLMSTAQYKPDPSYHFMNHPTTAGLYMFMLCYKNGSLARERVRDVLNLSSTDPNASSNTNTNPTWDAFNSAALSTPPLGQSDPGKDPMHLALYFPLPEIVPRVHAGEWHFHYTPATKELKPLPNHNFTTSDQEAVSTSTSSQSAQNSAAADARGIVESQFLSLRLRSSSLVVPQHNGSSSSSSSSSSSLPPQPRRIYLVGGGSVNPAIAQLAGEVLGGSEGVFRLDVGGNACALGSAYKAVWALERGEGEGFEDFVSKRWDEDGFVKRVDVGYRKGVWERYGEAVEGFRRMEEMVVADVGREGDEEVAAAGTRRE